MARPTPNAEKRRGLVLAKVSSLLLLLAVLAVSTSTSAASSDAKDLHRRDEVLGLRAAVTFNPMPRIPQRRSYDTHHYYAVEIRASQSDVDPEEVARLLGVEFVEQVGELKDHWLVRSEKPLVASPEEALARRNGLSAPPMLRRHLQPDDDPVLRRWEELRKRRHTSDHGLEKRDHHVVMAIRDVERQELKRLHKRSVIYSPWDTPGSFPQVREPIPGPEPQPYPAPGPQNGDNGKMMKTAQMQRQFDIKDPLFPKQWHLANNQRPGFDLNLTSVWAQGIKGKGVNVCLIDDGLDMESPDLKPNFFALGSYDFNDYVALPNPRMADDQHGTRCAGEIAAIKNDVCGVGVAHEAHVSGIRILSGPITDVDEAAALNHHYHENHVYSCSWGPPDDGRSMDAPKGLIAKAMLNGIQNGRNGKGSIYVFAGGNGGAADDQCNFDGYTNSIYSMTIAAADREGLHPYYSEMCAANLATGWSSGSGDHIHTTDVAWNGVNRCTHHHGGTSAAAPLVAGVVALALGLRPELTWRDVQHIAIHSAQMIAPEDADWQKTQAGRHYNHKFGYGVIDAHAFIEETKKHVLVNPQAWYTTPNVTLAEDKKLITEKGVSSTFVITEQMLKDANLDTLEHVTVRVWISHQRRGDVDVVLISPHGTQSVLARPRRYDDAKTGFPGWGFMTLKHWDESPFGEWTMIVYDKAHPDKTGHFHAWQATLWGASIDPAKAVPWNFPEDSLEYHETLASAPSTTTVLLPPGGGTTAGVGASSQRPKPTDHLPEDHGTASGEMEQDFTNGKGSTIATPEADTGYLSGLKANSTWLFVAAGSFIICAASFGIFFFLRARRARRGGAGGVGGEGGYEFVGGAEDDEEDLAMSSLRGGGGLGGATRMGKGSGRGRKGPKTTKELYDAFGEVTDSEEEEEEEEEARRLVGRGPSRGLTSGRGGYHDVEDDEEGDARFAIGDEPLTGTASDPTSSATLRGSNASQGGDVPKRLSGEAVDTTGRDGAEDHLIDVEGEKEERSAGDEGSGTSGESWQEVGDEKRG